MHNTGENKRSIPRRGRERSVRRHMFGADPGRISGMSAHRFGSMRIISSLVSAVVLAGLLGLSLNCGVLIERNRVLTGFLDENLAPESAVGQAAFAPLAMPIGLATLTVDGVVINPIRHVPDSIANANWVFTEVPFAGVGEILIGPMRILTYPVIFVGSVLFYTTVPID